MKVCIAEKPSVAREIARVLGATRQCDGFLEGNGYRVTWTVGHLCELKYPEDYTPLWRAWSLAQLPMVPQRFGIRLKDDKGIIKQFHVIERLFADAEEIINCGDAGQEGELIQRWVMQKAGVKCPVKRLWVSSLTEESIREGFENLKPQDQYQGMYEAGLCRAIGDWLLGMNATRLYTLRYGRQERGVPPLSIGRVQTPTLALIVKRQHEIENFKPEPYWVLTTRYRDVIFTANPKAEKEEEGEEAESPGTAGGVGDRRWAFATEEEGRAALDKVREAPFIVNSVTRKNGTEAPPRLFDLTALQVECNKKFGYSADQTLQLIQSLYEKKYTTYPRVDTTYLSDDIYPKCAGILNGIQGQYGELLTPLRGAKLLKRKKVFDNSKVTDHHAIIPTGVPAQAMTDMERNVYDLLTRRFIAVFYPDCKFATTTVWGQAAEIPFKATGKQILEQGWRTVFAQSPAANTDEDNDKEGDKERELPEFVKGESGPHYPDLATKETQPPKPYTEATLLRAMETAGRMVDNEELRDALKENGIGRPSTRAAIIETLFRRKYIEKKRKTLYATPTGVELIGLIKEELLKSAELTGRWERKLRQIDRGEYSAQQFIGELKEMVGDVVRQVMSDNTNRRITIDPSLVDKSLPPVLEKARVASQQETAERPKRKVIRAGSKCPVCGEGKVIKGKTAFGCSRWKEGCDFRKPFK
ncbi:MAG: DNA topoisomerase 3 [Bacteroidaceae bacterium]|nr:DNA topoisomerase 3 [Bacteroidaceae bacterium]